MSSRERSSIATSQGPSTVDSILAPSDTFARRHIGPRDRPPRCSPPRVGSLDELIDQTVPASIRARKALALPAARGEHELLEELRDIASRQPGPALVHRHGLLRHASRRR